MHNDIGRYERDMDSNSTASERVVVAGRDRLELQPWLAPGPDAGQLRIRVAYSAVSFGDVMLRRHVFRDRPTVAVPGYEVVGTVDAIGPHVTGRRLGERVAVFVEYGGNARHAVVRAQDAVSVPEGVDDPHAAAVILNYATALGMFEAAGLAPGDDLLVQGASGGVGSATLDTARASGLRAFGTTRTDTSVDLFGARLFDARSRTLIEDVRAASGGGVRAVFDGRAGRGLWQSRAMVKRGGSLIVFGLSSVANRGARARVGSALSIASLALFRALHAKRTSLFRMDETYRRDPSRVSGWVARALDVAAAGAIAPIIGATLPLEQITEAHRVLESGRIVGKVVIDSR